MKSIRFIAALTAAAAVAFTGIVGVNNTAALAESNIPVNHTAVASTTAGMPDDPYYARQWALPRMQNLAVNTAEREIIVAVLDSGIDAAHEDLAGKIIESVNFSGSQTANDLRGHGTHIAGILAANANNHIGIAGAAPNVKLLNVKVAEDDGTVWPSKVARGIIWAVDRGARVINMSLAITSYSSKLADAVKYANEHGVIMVASAGNRVATTAYPAALPGVISVAALNPDSTVWDGSTGAGRIDAYAPGASIYSTVPGNRYEYKSGSSMAAAYVSALVALTLGGSNDAAADGQSVSQAIDSLKTFSVSVAKN